MLFIRVLFIVMGSISLILGIIGIFVPMLPTTPFLLLTAYLYYKSSPRCYEWLMRQPHIGNYIRNFKEKKIIPVRAKIISIGLMCISITYCVVFLIKFLPAKIFLLMIMVGVTWHILSFRSK